MSNINIRTANQNDLAQIAAVEAQCFPVAEAATEQSFAQRLRWYPDHFWLMEQCGQIVGFVNGMVTDQPHLTDELYERAELHQENGAWQMIFGVTTVPACRRQGCAELLLYRVIADAKRQGRKGLVLTCKDALVHYYAKFGFVDEGISNSKHGGVVWHEMRLIV